MRFIHSLTKLTLLLFCTAAAVTGCKDSKDVDRFDNDYGFVQFKIYKEVTPVETRAGELEYLRDAYKIKFNFIYNNTEISDIGFFEYYDEESAEFGLRTDKIKLLAGNYKLTSYTIYNDLEDQLVVVYLDEEVVVEPQRLTFRELYIDAVNRGKIRFDIVKDFSNFPQSRARNREYAFSEIRMANVTLVNTDTNREISLNGMKTTASEDIGGHVYMATDTLYSIEAGKYRLKEYRLFSRTEATAANLLENRNSFNEPIYYVIQDNVTLEGELPVTLVETDEYIKDYYALKEIWESLNGPDWYYFGPTYAEGTNWNFDKDIDTWGSQPGVHLHSNGRVGALIIGAFGPYGEVPDAIGQLTAMSELSLGSSYDLYNGQSFSVRSGAVKRASYPTLLPGNDNSGDVILEDPLTRKWSGKTSGTVMETKFEDSRLWRKSVKGLSELEKAELRLAGKDDEPVFYSRNGYAPSGQNTNGITKISEKIGELTNITHLYISNTLLEELPQSIADLVNVTDFDLYNNPRMKQFPMQITDLPSLQVLNLAQNKQWSHDELYRGLEALFRGNAGEAGDLQGLYCSYTNLQKVPETIQEASKLYLLDLSWCQLTGEMTSFTSNVRIGMLYLNNNEITGFPEDFSDFRDCEDFDVSYNKLTKFPNIFNKTVYERCETVNFSHNLITEVEGESDGTFRGVIADRLDLSNNKMKDFPAAFNSDKTQVKYYSFAFNEIEEIEKEALTGMWVGTLSFNLAGNMLTGLPNSFNGATFPYLYSVDLSANRFKSMPFNPLDAKSLAIYIMQSQTDENGNRCLRSISTEVYPHTGMGYLDVRGNDLLSLGVNWPWRLRVILVRDNPNIVITVPSTYCSTINSILVYDNTQNITGCPQLTTNAQKEL